MDRVTAQSRAPVVGVARHFYYAYRAQQIRLAPLVKEMCILKMRGSYSGNTSAFQADAESSILLPRSNFSLTIKGIYGN